MARFGVSSLFATLSVLLWTFVTPELVWWAPSTLWATVFLVGGLALSVGLARIAVLAWRGA